MRQIYAPERSNTHYLQSSVYKKKENKRRMSWIFRLGEPEIRVCLSICELACNFKAVVEACILSAVLRKTISGRAEWITKDGDSLPPLRSFSDLDMAHIKERRGSCKVSQEACLTWCTSSWITVGDSVSHTFIFMIIVCILCDSKLVLVKKIDLQVCFKCGFVLL